MADWVIHWLEAEGSLGPWRSRIEEEIAAAREAVSRAVAVPRLDILVQRLPWAVIPEIGMVGHTHRKSLVALMLDPDNPRFASCINDDTLRRQVAHEAHHALRMAGPGYGRTLGEALVSEGLAGQFVGRLFDNPPEPWECAVSEKVLRAHRPDAAMLATTAYDHAAWFFGTKDKRYPRWLGYTLGYRIVGEWLAGSEASGDTLVNVSADTVLSAASRLLS